MTRVVAFGAGGTPEFYLSSADWMTRNLDRRIEVSVPIYDAALQAEVSAMLECQIRDNVKRRRLDKKQQNRYVPVGKDDDPMEAHRALYAFYERQLKDKG